MTVKFVHCTWQTVIVNGLCLFELILFSLQMTMKCQLACLWWLTDCNVWWNEFAL